jgi:hypothetical protein
LNPTEALAVSRDRLGQALSQAVQGQPIGAEAGEPAPSPSSQSPVGLLAALAHRWWRHHPWRQAGELAVEAADTLVRPLAQSHPATLMAGAAAVGALLVWSRPWRLLRSAWLPLSSSVLPGLLPQLLRDLLRPPSS